MSEPDAIRRAQAAGERGRGGQRAMSHYTEMQCSICGWEPRPMGESNLYYTFGAKEFHERMRTHYEWHRAKASAGEPAHD